MLKTIAIKLIGLYRYMISPLLGNACRFEPSCSCYTEQAINKYGLIKGCFLGLKRILRCHPFSRGGFDPLS